MNAPPTEPFSGTAFGLPLSFNASTSIANTDEQLLFTVPCASTVTLYFSGTLAYYSVGEHAAPATQQLNISLVNAAAPAVQLNPSTPTSSELLESPGFSIATTTADTYIYPQPVSLTASFALLPGTYAARVSVLLTQIATTHSFVDYLGGSMTAVVIKAQ
jgi:hypothetical protein